MTDSDPYDLREKYTHFRILVIGRANAGKTKPCNDQVCHTGHKYQWKPPELPSPFLSERCVKGKGLGRTLDEDGDISYRNG